MEHDIPNREAYMKEFTEKAQCRNQSFSDFLLLLCHQYPLISWSENALGVDSDL